MHLVARREKFVNECQSLGVVRIFQGDKVKI